MSFFSPPSTPDPTQLANQQMQYNKQAQQTGLFGQQTPYGSLSWNKDPNSPSGFTAKTALSPAQQQLLQLQQQGQTGAGSAAAGLGGQLAGLYGQPAQIDPSAMTKQLMDWQTQYMQPLWTQQQSNLDATLGNQGITPGSQAYNNAQNLLSRNISDQRNQFFAQSEPLAFSQALQQYQLPMQTESALMGMSQPQGPSFVPTPGAVQPPNYLGAAQQQFAEKQQQYNQMMQGIGQLAGIGLAPFTGGMSLFGSMPMFSGGWSGGSPGGTGGGLGGLY